MKHFLLLTLSLLSLNILAQNSLNHTNIWYFGGEEFNPPVIGEAVGLDFSSGSPQLISDAEMITREGCASICDENGNLLFYTDGSTIWNANHDTMSNGENLKGNFSASQSCIIIPKPGDKSIYYVFTVTFEGNADGMQVSEVDMKLDGGLGMVTSKNMLLNTPMVEKITAVHHANKKDIWVIAHKFLSNEFVAYLVTDNGIKNTPVVSPSGPIHGVIPLDKLAAIGCMKASHNGDWIATTRFSNDTVALHKFDVTSGKVTEYLPLTSPNQFYNFRNAYGFEFSPDDSKLYFATYQGGQVFQLDMKAGDAKAISNSTSEMGQCGCTQLGSMQLAKDGKIYISSEHVRSLGVITNPNDFMPVANYEVSGFNTGTATPRLGLPNFLQSYWMDTTLIPKVDPRDTVNIELNIPNVFTPNADPFNNVYTVRYAGYIEISVMIYNRWGVMVYDGDLVHDGGWNGRVENTGNECPEGTYFATIETLNVIGKRDKKSVTITLIR